MTYPQQSTELANSYLVPSSSAVASSHLLKRAVLVGLVASAIALGAFLFEAVTQYAM
jgi:hypothetical protein